VSLKFDHIEAQVIQGRAHWVELVLGLYDEFVEAVRMRPLFLLLRECAITSLSSPLFARTADLAIENLAI